MKKLLLLITILFTTAVSGFSQTKITQTRDVSGFTFVQLEIPATVYITQENHFSVQVSASQELLDKINTEMKDNTLEISSEKDNNWKNFKGDFWKDKGDVIIYISMPKPNGLQVSGSGIVKAQNNFTTDYLEIEVHGSGMIDLKDFKAEKASIIVQGSGMIKQQNGVASGLVEEVHGSGNIGAASLMSSVTSISLEGSGNIKINQLQSEKLEASLGGSGSITVIKGTASSTVLEDVGSGEIVAGDLVAGTVSAKVAGSGSISIGVVDVLEASVSGSGNVRYKGNPANVSKSVSGSGSVSRL